MTRDELLQRAEEAIAKSGHLPNFFLDAQGKSLLRAVGTVLKTGTPEVNAVLDAVLVEYQKG